MCVAQELMTPLEATPASAQGGADQALPSLSSCLQDLPQSVLLGLSQAGAAHRMPLTVALVSERARQQAAALDFMAWRDLIAGTSTVFDSCSGPESRHNLRQSICTMMMMYIALSLLVMYTCTKCVCNACPTGTPCPKSNMHLAEAVQLCF